MPETYLALLRGINVGGRTVPMPRLRQLCEDLGWQQVQTYIQSGNVIFETSGTPERLAAQLMTSLARTTGWDIQVFVRRGRDWPRYLGENPFPEASRSTPALVHLALAHSAPVRGAEAALQARAADGEQVRIIRDGIWVHYPSGSARSKLTPDLVHRLVASPVTARNWRTVVALDRLLRDHA